MGANFPGFPHLTGLAVSSHITGNWWENTCIFMWWIIPWNGNLMEKSTHTRGKVWVQISQVLHIWWVLLHFPVLWGIPKDGNRMGKNHPYYGESMSTNFPGSPHTMGFVAFSHTIRNWMGNPCISYMMKYAIGWKCNGEKSTQTMGKIWVLISQTFPIPWVLSHFPVLWEIDGETHAFPIWWHWLIFSCAN